MNSEPALIRAENVTADFGEGPLFAPVTFSLQPGARLALLGPSGCGKSTLLRIVAGLHEPSAGRIIRAAELRLGMVFQDLALWPNLTAQENVALALCHEPRVRRRELAQQALERCHVAELARRKPAALSIGQQQRVALARAIAARPRLLLLDEPFSSLNPALKSDLIRTVNDAVQNDCALLLVTHEEDEARRLGCQILSLI